MMRLATLLTLGFFCFSLFASEEINSAQMSFTLGKRPAFFLGKKLSCHYLDLGTQRQEGQATFEILGSGLMKVWTQSGEDRHLSGIQLSVLRDELSGHQEFKNNIGQGRQQIFKSYVAIREVLTRYIVEVGIYPATLKYYAHPLSAMMPLGTELFGYYVCQK